MTGRRRAVRRLAGRARAALWGRSGGGRAATSGAAATAGPGGSGSTATDVVPEDDLGRLREAVAMVAEAERLSPVLTAAPAPVGLLASGRVVRRPHLDAHVAHLVPDRVGRGPWSEQDPGVVPVAAPVAADLVVLGKLDLQRRPKLRAVYAGAARTLVVQPSAPSSGSGVARVLGAHEVVGRHAPHLIAPLLDHGALADGTPYLVEGWVAGTPLGGQRALAAAAPHVLAGLAAVHRGHGTTRVRLSEHWGPALAGRWEAAVAAGVVPGHLASWVVDLIERDGLLRRSFIHGDLVASNVLQVPDGVVLVDWEHAQEGVLMNDAAKLHLFAADPQGVLDQVLDVLGDADPAVGAYDPLEELALCHAQLVSLYPARRSRLDGHPRAATYERQVARQVGRLDLLAKRVGRG